MASMTLFIIFISIIAILFLVINLLLAPHNPYQEKETAFECGFHSFLQTREPFAISFYIYAILFLIFDLEIFSVYPGAIGFYNLEGYGTFILTFFLVILTAGFVFELGKGALDNESKQNLFETESVKKKISYLNFQVLNS